MTISYQLDEEDYLQYQLYAASQSERIKKTRRRRRWVIPVLYIVLGLFFLRDETNITWIVLIIIAILWLFFYPLWDSRYYKRHYTRWVRENVTDAIGRMTTVTISDDHITVSDGTSESKIALADIKEIVEIPGMILVRIKGGHSLVMPRNKIAGFGSLTNYLQDFANHSNIPYRKQDNWRWK